MRTRISKHSIDNQPANGPVKVSYISKEEATAVVPQAIPRNHKKPFSPTFKRKVQNKKPASS